MNKIFENLQIIKDQLFDAPDEIKGSFNTLVKYFDSGKHFVVHVLGGPTPDWITVFSKDQLLERFKLKEEDLHKGYTWTCDSSMGKMSFEILEGPMSKMKAQVKASHIRHTRFKHFDGKGKGKSNPEEDKLLEKFGYDGYLTVSEMSRLERLQDGQDGSISEARNSKIPHFDSMIVLDMEEGPGSQLLNGPVHKASTRKLSIWKNGKKFPAAVWVNQFTTEDGIVYYEVMDNFYGQLVCNKSDLSKLLKGASVRSYSKTGKGARLNK